MSYKVGLVGARGHTGAELLKMIALHPQLELAFVSSREHLGQAVPDFDLVYLDHDPAALSQIKVDAVILAVPNGKTAAFIEAFEQRQPQAILIDLSADRRFDADWYYGLPELTRTAATGAKRISNPGCYATAMQLVLAPINHLLDPERPPQCFGVSGYSGAGTTPSERNNPELLANNLMPYASVDHMHEREVTHRLGRAIEFMPNVAGYFRGISMTVNVHFSEPQTADAIRTLLKVSYADEPLIHVSEEVPWVASIAGQHGAGIGGITVSSDGMRGVIVSTLDNLLKGAATQAMQNLNIALGLDEFMGIPLAARDKHE